MNTIEQQTAHWQVRLKALESTQHETEDELHKMLNTLSTQIEQLKTDNSKMKQSLSQEAKAATSTQLNRIDTLRDLAETYNRKVEVAGRQLESMQQELEISQVKLQDAQRLAGGPQLAAESAKHAGRARQQLENRLEQVQKRFGESLSHNKKLRQEIEAFNKERLTFQQLFSKLEQQLSRVSSEVQAVRTSTTVCKEAHTLMTQQVAALRLQADKEAAAAQAELQELKACQEAEKSLMQVQAQRLMAVSEAIDQDGGLPTPETLEAGLCDNLIHRLQEATGISDLSDLVSHLTQLESLNYNLFSDCNQANERVGSMQQELKALQAELQEVEEGSGKSAYKEVIKATQAKRDQAIKRTEGFNSKRVAMERRLALVRAGVGSTLKTLGGQLTPAARPEDPGCVYATLLQNLGQLEARCRAVLAVHSTLAGRETASTKAMLSTHLSGNDNGRPPSAGRLAGKSSLEFQLPGTGLSNSSPGKGGFAAKSVASRAGGAADNSNDCVSDEDSDDDVVPLTRAQLHAQIGVYPSHH